MNTHLSKQNLRLHINQQRLAMSDTEQESASRALIQQLLKLPNIQLAHNIAFYAGFQKEIDPINLCEYLSNKAFFLPTILQDQLLFHPFVTNSALIKNTYGIDESHTNEPHIDVDKLDVIIMPLVGFNLLGQRVGRGKGYYDKTLSTIKNIPQEERPLLIGAAYEFQKIDLPPADPWDIPLDMVVTDEHIYHCNTTGH